MGVTVVGSWELGYLSPLTEAVLWTLPLRDFGVADWRMWPVSGIRCPEQRVTLTEFSTIDDALKDIDGVKVFVEARNSTFSETMDSVWLHDFEHPDDAIYIFGSAGFCPVVGRKGDDVQVSVKTVENAGVPWPHQVAFAVLYDRLVKSWQ